MEDGGAVTRDRGEREDEPLRKFFGRHHRRWRWTVGSSERQRPKDGESCASLAETVRRGGEEGERESRGRVGGVDGGV